MFFFSTAEKERHSPLPYGRRIRLVIRGLKRFESHPGNSLTSMCGDEINIEDNDIDFSVVRKMFCFIMYFPLNR